MSWSSPTPDIPQPTACTQHPAPITEDPTPITHHLSPITRTSVLLVRHGQTDWNLEGRYQGRTDVPLNSLGWEQAERLGEGLATARVDAVYSSPLARSLETARAVARRHRREPRLDPRLIEIDQGEWEGRLAEEIAALYPERFTLWCREPRATRPPGGESLGEVHDRAVAAVEEMATTHPGGGLCVVTHKTVIVVLRCHYLGLDLREEMGRMPAHATWELIVVSPGRRPPGEGCCSASGADHQHRAGGYP